MLSSWSFIGCWICACTLMILVQRSLQMSEGQRGVFSLPSSSFSSSSSSSSSSTMTPLYFFLFILSSSGLPSLLPLTFSLCLSSSSPILSFLTLLFLCIFVSMFVFSVLVSHIILSLSSFHCAFTYYLLFSLIFSPRFFLSFPSPFLCLFSFHVLLSSSIVNFSFPL